MRLHPTSLVLAAALIAPAAAFTAACGATDNTDAAQQPAAEAAAARPTLDSQLRRLVAAGAPGAIALVNDGRTVRLHAVGVADRHTRRAMRATDRFRAGSMAKPFVSTVALQLVGEGKLSLTDTVEHWLPGALPYGEQVTLRQLLSHTSGVPDNQEPVEAEWLKGNLTHSWAPRTLIAFVATKEQDFAPGTSWAYSNTNYMLAGMIIERATGHRLADEIGRRVLKPLHLRDTSFPVNRPVMAGSHANGAALVQDKLVDVTVLNPSGVWGAGNIVSTATDIAHFWRALLGGRLLAPAQLAAMKTTVPTAKGSTVGYGLGIFRWPSECGALWGHGGDIAGYSNRFQNTEDGKRQAAVMVTVNPMSDEVGEWLGQTKRTAISDALHSSKLC
jgi:D-alanyl-D-alanine carboxypeptidase